MLIRLDLSMLSEHCLADNPDHEKQRRHQGAQRHQDSQHAQERQSHELSDLRRTAPIFAIR